MLRSLFALSERYPQLRANENFLALQTSLQEIEEALQNARRYYNAVVRDFNTKTEVFPSNLVARQFRFAKREYFEVEDEAVREAPQVKF
jgi:LemA protein